MDCGDHHDVGVRITTMVMIMMGKTTMLITRSGICDDGDYNYLVVLIVTMMTILRS